ncbi:hypothetical protein JCM3766R1_005935, partial [Sporobolomyces carnicolor]
MSYGGGFLAQGASQGSNGSPSGGGGKKAGSTALRPVTIHQVISAQQAFGDAEFMIDGQEVKDVTLVACIRSVNITTTQATFLIEDGTGQIDCRMWIESSGAEDGEKDSRLANIDINRYVRILGSIKTFADKRHIGAQRVRAITDMNEINFHLIECAYVHKCILNGPPGGGGNTAMVTDRPYDGAGGNPYAAEGGTAADDSVKHLPQGQRQIWHFIKSQLEQGDTQDEGVNIMAIARHVGLPVDRVREMTANMVEEGHLYDGLDGD